MTCYRRALELNPAYFDAHNNLGNALRSQGKLAESVCRYERALELKPDHPQVRMSRALSLAADGRLRARMGRVRMAAQVRGVFDSRFSASRSGTALVWTGGRSCCTPTTAWVIRFSSSAMHPW